MAMKLGTETGSVMNAIMSRMDWNTPQIGMGATLLFYTDRKPATVIAISKSGKTVTLQEDTATRIDENGMSDNQHYEYSPDPNGRIFKARQRKGKGWRVCGEGTGVTFGRREKYFDYSF